MDCQSLAIQLQAGLMQEWDCEPHPSAEGAFSLLTTALYPNNDAIELLIFEQNGLVSIVDDGHTNDYLLSYGINLASKDNEVRLAYVRAVAESFGAEFDGSEFRIQVSWGDIWNGVTMMLETLKKVAFMGELIPVSRARSFNDVVYGFFEVRDANVRRDYDVMGFSKKHRFDLYLNGNDVALVRTISSMKTSNVQVGIERALFAFNDFARMRDSGFSPYLVYDDTEEEYADAWKERHFKILARYQIPALGFEQDRPQLETLAERHRRPEEDSDGVSL